MINKGTIATSFIDCELINSKAASMRQLMIAAGYESLDFPIALDEVCG
ncbi:hypothetical protein [Vibrio diazotrophicus]|nr:hypothetical protein [Vibrio diazotrophicus]NIY92045.1 hypothetical protein [Vibrio diazotrophicus]